jgi:uncharacterized membrane protein
MTDIPVNPNSSKPFVIRILLARPILFTSFAIGIAVAFLLPTSVAKYSITQAIIGWNVGSCLYIVLAFKMMFWSTHEKMCTRTLQHDEGSAVVLMLVVTAALMCIGAIVAELAVVKDLKGGFRYAHIALAALTIASSWAFTQIMFALHYAHDYYATVVHGDHGGLEFPSGQPPDYGDFLYFSSVIGTSGQTADVSITTDLPRMATRYG